VYLHRDYAISLLKNGLYALQRILDGEAHFFTTGRMVQRQLLM
jgi:hypothetical protein